MSQNRTEYLSGKIRLVYNGRKQILKEGRVEFETFFQGISTSNRYSEDQQAPIIIYEIYSESAWNSLQNTTLAVVWSRISHLFSLIFLFASFRRFYLLFFGLSQSPFLNFHKPWPKSIDLHKKKLGKFPFFRVISASIVVDAFYLRKICSFFSLFSPVINTFSNTMAKQNSNDSILRRMAFCICLPLMTYKLNFFSVLWCTHDIKVRHTCIVFYKIIINQELYYTTWLQ